MHPGGFKSWQRIILVNAPNPFDHWIFFQYRIQQVFLCQLFFILWYDRGHMSQTICFENVLRMMDPRIKTGQLHSLGMDPVFCVGNLLWLVFYAFELSPWNYRCRMIDTSNLGAKKVLFLTYEMRVAVYLLLQVTGKQATNLSCDVKLCWKDIR